MRGIARYLLTALLLLAAGCAAPPQTRSLLDDPGALPRRAAVAGVPFHPQEKYYCGPAATAMLLGWSGLPVTQQEMAAQVYTPGREGTLQADVIAAIRRNGRLAVPVGDLRVLLGEVAAGRPVLVFQNLALDFYPRWHFAVVTGYDIAAGQLTMNTGISKGRPVPLDTFEHTWRRGGYWALVALRPGEMPVAARRDDLIRAAAGLERVGRPADAATAYSAILRRWPQSFAAWMGLGNAHYALANHGAAEFAWRHAIAEADRNPAPAWNNLAYALIAQDRRDEAIEAAERALELAGQDSADYRETLAEIAAM